uniref:AIG1-type G domain-containing protein n=1 Tax=Xiphophorus couchianus TaxID=32473 RepID=A0A3B5M3V6_9TELE
MSEYLREGFNGSSASDLRLLLLGNIGCGKTSSGDTILGQLSPSNSDSSRICAQRQGVTEGRSVTIVEAPRWYWVGSNIDDDIKKETEIVQCGEMLWSTVLCGKRWELLRVKYPKLCVKGFPRSLWMVLSGWDLGQKL